LGELFKTSAPRLEPGSGTFAAFAEVISLTQSPPSTDFQICLVTKVTDRGVWNHCQETSIFVQSIQRCISPPPGPHADAAWVSRARFTSRVFSRRPAYEGRRCVDDAEDGRSKSARSAVL